MKRPTFITQHDAESLDNLMASALKIAVEYWMPYVTEDERDGRAFGCSDIREAIAQDCLDMAISMISARKAFFYSSDID